jgi:hypothetical protein
LPLVELKYTHPNSGQVYHRELWEPELDSLLRLRAFLEREDVQEEYIQDNSLNQHSPARQEIQCLLSEGRQILDCEPKLSVNVYWRRPGQCTCEHP